MSGLPLLARLAEIEWAERIALGRRLVANGAWSTEEAETRLMPWLAMALWAGAEPEEAAAELEAARRDPWFAGHARCHVAQNCCDVKEMRAELERARDAAVQRAIAKPDSREDCDRSARLQYLAVYLGCAATSSTSERIAA